ncbi:hypothetical protein K2173_018425 [Erythroxylum novogranatense]|uniref:Peptidase A1 domain-containing protein n=1 Tax=Erythroxylum novogranatense TaxID=1862640 RepID=A0AAV8UAM4_9ROSI|nr:hypothetical protein K2173_018425 [Erythroxylum novogranatense]
MSVSLLLYLCFIPTLVHGAFLLPIQKDHNTRQYTTTIYLKTPLQPTKLLVDLGASFTWVDCYNNYSSISYRHVPCGTSLCDSFHSLACGNCYQPPGPACANDTCDFYPENSVTRHVNLEAAIIDALALLTTDGLVQGPLAVVENYIFSCARTSLLKGLAKGVSGTAALGRSNISVQSQVRETFAAPNSFALCLSGSRSAPGVGFIGSRGPYIFSPGIDMSKSLSYTPLLVNPVQVTVITIFGRPSDEYLIGLTSIKVNGKVVQLNKTLLAIDSDTGYGGTKISTVIPYATLQTSIYNAFTEAFVRESSAMNLTVAKPVKPFKFCYQAKGIINTRLGPAVPIVDLVLQSESMIWRILGANMMVKVTSKHVDLWCLGFVDGGANPRTPIVIGGRQIGKKILCLILLYLILSHKISTIYFARFMRNLCGTHINE